MKKNILLLFVISLFIFSCEDDVVTTTDLDSEWILTSFSCYCPPEVRNIEVGDHIWTIDSEEKSVSVENNSNDPSQNTLLSTGSYPISIIDTTITIANQSYDFYLKEGQLILSNKPELDGPILTFIKKSAFVEKTDTCSVKAIESENIYANGPAAQHFIESVKLTNDCLYISYTSSGCSGDSWEVQLVDEGVVMESLPVQKNIRLSLTNEEDCQAVFKKELWVDLSPLQVSSESKINFNLEGWNDQILYEY